VQESRKREKNLKAAEYRLQHELQRLSSLTASNSVSKDEVESLRRDRLQRQTIVERLEAKLAKLRVSEGGRRSGQRCATCSAGNPRGPLRAAPG
jgi:hypothetical protein